MTSRLRLVVATTLAIAGWLVAGPGRLAGSPQDPSEPAVTLRVIVVTAADAAQRLADRLARGESFAALAQTESTEASAAIGGWLGRLPLAQLRPDVRQAVQALAPGQITTVIRIPTGFAIFKREADDPAAAPAAVGAALAASGTVKYVYDVSGFSDARAIFESFDKPAGWDLDAQATCRVRNQAIAESRAAVEARVAQGDSGDAPLDRMQLHVALGQLEAFEGRLDRTIVRLEEAARLASAQAPAAALDIEEALGIAHLHKAGLDNDLFRHSSELCLLSTRPRPAYAKTADVEQAVGHFRRYLERKPDALEVRWLLNLAVMALGTYPASVPAAYLIPPSALQSAEDVGRFRDVAASAGLTTFAAAGGAIVEDFDRRGRFDVVASTADKCAAMSLFSNAGDGTFTDRTAAAGLSTQWGGLNAVAGDYNNDGCQDIVILRGGWEELPQRISLLENRCDGTFTDVTVASGLGAPMTTQSAVWTDIDNDGFLDLFVGVENAPSRLYRNKHDGTFDEIGAAAGVGRTAYTKGVVAADYDNDRYPDLYVSNYGGRNFLYHNNRNGTFTEFAEGARVLGTPQGFATWFFDYDNDGRTDLFVTSYVASIEEMVRDYLRLPHNATTMKLYRNQGDGTFRDVSLAVGLDRVRMPMGANFGDIDNDGFLDMYLGTGNPSYGALAGAVLLRNQEGRAFVDVTMSSGTGELHRGHGVAFADLDNDGDEDILFQVGGMTTGDRHAMRLFENPGHGNDWISLKLTGVKSNRTAVGARIAVTVAGANGRTRTIHRTVSTGGSFGSSPLEQHIGLGKAARITDLEIWWPTSDTRQHFTDVPKNQWLRIEELATSYTRAPRTPVTLGGTARRTP